MLRHRQPHSRFLTSGLLFLFAGWMTPTYGQPVMVESLLENSPFLPPQTQASQRPMKGKPTKNPITEQLEFRGLMEYGGEYLFSIFDRERKSSRWMEINRSPAELDYQLIEYLPGENRVRIQWGDHEALLELITTSNRGLLKPVSGNLMASDYFDTPAPPPTVKPPKNAPPPPPLSAPPPGPPPEVPTEVLERFEKMIAERESLESGGFVGGISGSAPSAPPSSGLRGLPAVSPSPSSGPGGGNGSGGDGNTGGGSNPLPGIQIPDIPGIRPGQGPPTPPPNIVIPEIPDFPQENDS